MQGDGNVPIAARAGKHCTVSRAQRGEPDNGTRAAAAIVQLAALHAVKPTTALLQRDHCTVDAGHQRRIGARSQSTCRASTR
jgi:hypothetical protein